MKIVINILFAITFAMFPNLGQAQQNELSAEEAKALVYLLEEEKMAHDAYQTFYEQYGHHVFGNILQSEQRHLEKVKSILDTHEIEYRLAEEKGVFYDPEIKALYAQLIETGTASLEQALETGKLIEETDIADLKQAVVATANPELTAMYTKLIEASEHHLAAFTRNLENGSKITGKQGTCKKEGGKEQGCKKRNGDNSNKESCKNEGCKKESCKKANSKL